MLQWEQPRFGASLGAESARGDGWWRGLPAFLHEFVNTALTHPPQGVSLRQLHCDELSSQNAVAPIMEVKHIPSKNFLVFMLSLGIPFCNWSQTCSSN